MDNHLAKLAAELRATELWDDAYDRCTKHDDIDVVSYRARRERRQEIMREIVADDPPVEVRVE